MTHPATVVLVGLRGAGKTSVGRALARELELPFVDLDEELAREAGASAEDFTAWAGNGGPEAANAIAGALRSRGMSE